MTPSQSMGLFLTTWRSQWAHLSREQLAITLSARLSKRQAVTANVLRQWEQGQPPGSLEELDALCLLMRRHSLSQPEVGQFRDAVLAACLDRHYEGLFAGEDFAQRTDCDALAYAALDTEWHVRMGGTNTVTLVAWCHELRRAADARLHRAAPNSQEHRQDLALAWVLHALAKNHLIHGRPAESFRAIQECAVVINARLGAGAGSLCAPHLLRWHVATTLAHRQQNEQALQRLLALADERRAAGDRHWTHGALTWAIWPACGMGSRDATELLHRHEGEVVAYADDNGDSELHAITHRSLCAVDLARGQVGQAERRLEQQLLPYERRLEDRIANGSLEGVLAMARGDYAEAHACLSAVLEAEVEMGFEAEVPELRRKLAACERAQEEARHRGKSRTSASRRGA